MLVNASSYRFIVLFLNTSFVTEVVYFGLSRTEVCNSRELYGELAVAPRC